MNDRDRLWPWFVANWSRAALPCAVVSLVWLALFLTDDNRPLVFLFSLLPVYMIHQVEEHAHGRFVAFFNRLFGDGRPVVTVTSLFWMNIVAVWLLMAVAFGLARWVDLGFALIPVYVTVLNGVTHLLASLHTRSYNPGLATTLLLFLPWGVFLLTYFNGKIDHRLLYHLVGLAVGILGHVVIMGFVIHQRRLTTPTPAGAIDAV